MEVYDENDKEMGVWSNGSTYLYFYDDNFYWIRIRLENWQFQFIFSTKIILLFNMRYVEQIGIKEKFCTCIWEAVDSKLNRHMTYHNWSIS
jgi:hypothetical protein